MTDLISDIFAVILLCGVWYGILFLGYVVGA